MRQHIRKFCQNLETIVRCKPKIDEISYSEATGVELQFPKNPMELKVILPDSADCVVAETAAPVKPKLAKSVIEEVQRLGYELGTGSVLIADDADTIPGSLWEGTTYDKQYYLSLDAGAGEADFDTLVNNKVLTELGTLMEKTLSMPVRVERNIDERPYVISMDYLGPSEGDEEPPFHMYMHLHELTGSIYVEKIELPGEKRNNGYGTKFMDYVKWFSKKYGFSYIYLEAAVEAERFWERHGFEYLYRTNIRKELRRKKMIRRRPGWERSWVGDYRLQEPQWRYRSHPQDDLDLITGLLVEDRAWKQIRSVQPAV